MIFTKLHCRTLRFIEEITEWGALRLAAVSRWCRLRFICLDYEGYNDDIFIVSYPKSGTTLLQMIVYQLTSDGLMDIPHIDAVSPHFEETFLNRNISDLNRPRVLKSHLPYREAPRGPGRYIYVLRDGRDVAISYWHQLQRHFPDFGQFFADFTKGTVPHGSWFSHVRDWVENRDGLNVHIVKYEDLVSDMGTAIRGIATFLGIRLDEAVFVRVLSNCTLESMRAQEGKFSLHTRDYNRPRTIMIRKGKAGGWRETIKQEDLEGYNSSFERDLTHQFFDAYRPLDYTSRAK
jgi:hypothetical protein